MFIKYKKQFYVGAVDGAGWEHLIVATRHFLVNAECTSNRLNPQFANITIPQSHNIEELLINW